MKAYYSILQFIQDLDRLETKNVGLILFCPEVNVLKLETVDLSSFFLLEVFKERFMSEDIKTKEELERFISTRANNFRLTELRSVVISNPEEEIKNLMDKLVY